MATIPFHPPPANFTAAHALLGRLYLEHRDFLRRLLLVQAIPSSDVEDVVQEVFLTAWRRLECLVTPEQARPWLLVIGLNHARNHRNLARCEREVLAGLADDLPEQEVAAPMEMLLQATYGMFRLKRFLLRIGPRIRAVVVPYLEGRSIREIAEALGIKTKTAFARLHLAREHLKRLALA
ncbi:RNA polymerase sigma factor [Polyangium jinanense]|uniref:RNA polymerase sigma factor n=1 Tax=Polyangium jinanense TaxID=2829994 RepID=A0A9X4ASL0_9BACT|nr:RNA polymerase sigma factor [Polyangium jinanense]MDC3955880.1 RNA polymerase sigma factor [Polyangium jinanense]MDC3983239.1 RNA polymerase sigma factor [Polyangium jinanense]MDC3985181.1 RNA polymerase sigma factor [Polyangium jinanense]